MASWVGIATDMGAPRVVPAYGITNPFSNPWVTPEEEKGQRRAVLEAALSALTETPAKPTVYWPNYGNRIGDQVSVGHPTVDFAKDWDWKIR